MATSRRNFLKTGTLGVICAGVPAALASSVAGEPIIPPEISESDEDALVTLTQDAFAPHINSTFFVYSNHRKVSLRLRSITDLKAKSPHPTRIAGKESFSLLFQGSRSLPQETYVLEHGKLGRFSLFLVPVGKQSQKHHEAIIVRT